MNKHPLSFLGGLALGVGAMYCLYTQRWRLRRAWARWKVSSTGRDMAHEVEARARQAADFARDLVAPGRADAAPKSPAGTEWH